MYHQARERSNRFSMPDTNKDVLCDGASLKKTPPAPLYIQEEKSERENEKNSLPRPQNYPLL